MTDAPAYARSVRVALDHDRAVDRTTQELAEEGFGVLSRIDVAATLEAKLGVTRPPYTILGACNPRLAHGALEREPMLGALLPCNVVVHVEDGATRVGAVSAAAMLGIVGNPDLEPVAREVDARLGRVLDRLAAA